MTAGTISSPLCSAPRSSESLQKTKLVFNFRRLLLPSGEAAQLIDTLIFA
jgi:hypothetical protein